MQSRPLEPLRSSDPEMLGPYRLLRRLGEGGMGTVFLAEGPDGRRAAVKMIKSDKAELPEFRKRFADEVHAARQVRSFCTARFLDACLDGQTMYLATEFVPAADLGEIVRRRGPYGGENLENIALGIANALTSIHAVGLVHRDVKPSNILVPEIGLRVIDFGVAKDLDRSGLTAAGQFVGTARYAAPEALTGGEIFPAYDVFSWGCTVMFAGTGRTPFEGDGPHHGLYRNATAQPVLDGLPSELADIVRASLAKDPAHRPTAGELAKLIIGQGPDPDWTARIIHPSAAPPSIAVFGPDRENTYAAQLVAHLRGRGVPVRSRFEEPGLTLEKALALIVLVSPGEAEPVRTALADAARRDLPVLRILRGGIGTGIGGAGVFDARSGLLPGSAELAWTHRVTGTGPRSPVPEPSTDARLTALETLLGLGKLVAADQESTLALLRSAGRENHGWLRRAEPVDPGLLSAVGALWTRHTDGAHGFDAQLALHWSHEQPGSLMDFTTLCAAYGWSQNMSGRLNGYHDWVTRLTYPRGFFPTLRNPTDEMRNGWHGRWQDTVMAVHQELRRRP